MDSKKIAAIAGEAVVAAFVPGYMRAIYSALSESQSDVKAAESKGMPTLEEEAQKQQVLMEFQAHQARVAQELAIAERISVSSEVEIEEYYDTSGKGHVGEKPKRNRCRSGPAARAAK